ncbi:MAG: hypothetical protein ACK4M9_01965 [Anaerobacillus sp.]|uniref:hypothetical protein n=1 Tax=Anaerobacillus sp. TaxID=1872506 RepID=UPI003918ABDE
MATYRSYLELKRIHDSIDTHVLLSMGFLSNSVGQFTKPSLLMALNVYLDKLLRKKEPIVERVIKNHTKIASSIISEATRPAEGVLEELLKEIDRLLIYHGYSQNYQK